VMASDHYGVVADLELHAPAADAHGGFRSPSCACDEAELPRPAGEAAGTRGRQASAANPAATSSAAPSAGTARST
jgi:hypothetical protein